MLGFGQPPFGSQMVQGATGFPATAAPPVGVSPGAPGMPGMAGMMQPNMAPQIPQRGMPPMGMQMPPMPQNPIQSHDNGLLQMLLGPAMNGQNGQALGLLKMLAQMPHTSAPMMPQGMQMPGGATPPNAPQQGQVPPNFGQFLNFFGQGQ